MRDAGPLDGDVLVVVHVRAVILRVQISVQFAQGFAGRHVACLHSRVHVALEFRELRLAEDRPLEAVQILVDQVSLLQIVLRVGDQVTVQQGFVHRAGDLRRKDRVVRVHRFLVVRGIPGLHGVAHLVDDGEHVVQLVVIVQQDVGNAVVAARGERPAGLSFVLVHVRPAAREGVAHDLPVFAAKRLQRLVDDGLRRLVRDVLVRRIQDGHVDIVHGQVVQAQQFLAQSHVAVHGGQVGVDHVDQVVVYVRGDVIVEHGGFQRGAESADAGHCHVLLDAVGVQRRHGVPVVFVLRIHVFVCFPAHPSVLAGEQADVASVGHLGLFALLVQNGAELEVRVGQHGVGVVHHSADLRQLRQQFFLLIREDVRLVPQDLVQKMRVDCETRLCFDPAAQPVRGDARQFRREEARRFHDACVGHHRLIRQRLEFRDAVILAAAQTCVGIGFA